MRVALLLIRRSYIKVLSISSSYISANNALSAELFGNTRHINRGMQNQRRKSMQKCSKMGSESDEKLRKSESRAPQIEENGDRGVRRRGMGGEGCRLGHGLGSLALMSDTDL